jgi:hypothetical protein
MPGEAAVGHDGCRMNVYVDGETNRPPGVSVE